MNTINSRCYMHKGRGFYPGVKVQVVGVDDPDRNKFGTVLDVKAGGCLVRVGTAAVGHSSFWHPGALRLV